MYVNYTLYDYNADGSIASKREVPVDTDVLDNQQKWDWIGKQIGALGWEPQYVNNYTPSIVIQFKMPPEVPNTNMVAGQIGADACGSMEHPRSAAIDLAFQLGRVILPPEYIDPDTGNPTTPDWEVAGSPIGPPFEDPIKRLYQWKYTSHKEGDKYTGASGTVYQVVLVVTSPFSRMYAWKAL